LAGAPLAHWMGTPVSTLLVLAFLTPWLLNKRPVPQPVDFHPLWIWLLLGGWMGVYQLSLGHTSELGIHLLVTLMVVGAAWKGTRPEGPRSAVRAEYTKSDERLVH